MARTLIFTTPLNDEDKATLAALADYGYADVLVDERDEEHYVFRATNNRNR